MIMTYKMEYVFIWSWGLRWNSVTYFKLFVLIKTPGNAHVHHTDEQTRAPGMAFLVLGPTADRDGTSVPFCIL